MEKIRFINTLSLLNDVHKKILPAVIYHHLHACEKTPNGLEKQKMLFEWSVGNVLIG